MSIIDQTWFSKIKRPSRYLGGEINAIRKDPGATEVSVALAFPDVYEVGMSHLGLKILYQILNGPQWLAAERVFSPWVDLEEELRERGIPLQTLESGRPLAEFDILGFSLQHELSFTNVLTMLHLSGIPFLADQRDSLSPLVIAGGPACFNPEPVAALFDAIVIGDGEETTLEICKRLRGAKRKGMRSREDLLMQLIGIPGVYVPSFFKVHYNGDGTIGRIQPLVKGYEGVRKAILPDLNRYPSPCSQVVPFTQLVHDRLAVEISRGCTRGCRFCQAGMIYRPTREKDPQSVIRDAAAGLGLTGFEELSLLSLSSGDYGPLGQLLKALMDRQSEDKIAISLPSLRVDSLDPAWFDQIKRVRKTGFTLAPEAGTDRLRRVINKPLTNSEILRTAQQVYGAGWNLIKLYFMVGLPTEGDEDLEGIVKLADQVSRLSKGYGKRAKLNVSVATFVPKSHTPFMWLPQLPLAESRRRIQLIQDALKGRRVRTKWNQPELSWLEGIFSRGDRRLTGALIEAWQLGARFDAWGEHFQMGVWEEALKRSGLDPDFYLYRQRSREETLPWDHIQSGVRKRYLEREWEKALRGEVTADCRERCHECGVCDHERIDPVLIGHWAPQPKGTEETAAKRPSRTRKYRLTFSKTGAARFLSHLEVARLFVRGFKRAGLDLVYTKGYHPMPKISFFSALPVGTESLHETVDVEVRGVLCPSATKEQINGQLPKGIRILHLEDVTRAKKGARLRESHFQINLEGVHLHEGNLESFLGSEVFPVAKISKGEQQMVNARSLVKSFVFTPPHSIHLVMTHNAGPSLKPMDLVRGVFHLGDMEAQRVRVLKTRQVIA